MSAPSGAATPAGHPAQVSVVLDVSGMLRASETSVVEARLSRQVGVLEATANPVAQTATVTYDPAVTSVAELTRFITDCGFHCAGLSVPSHVCDRFAEPAPGPGGAAGRHEMSGPEMAAHEASGAGHDMAGMVADMRNRFLVAALFSVPLLLWSPIGRDVLGFSAAAPFGLRDDVWQLLLSLPVIGYSAWVFFAGAWRALRARTLDMMV
ncbi:MAG TPA: cation transporter, partial [Nocardioidaceae bacterium]